jgi:hypothetical protein
MIDSGISASNLYIVEALWDSSSYYNYGYSLVQQNLGAQLVNLNSAAPYPDFMDKAIVNGYFYSSFKFNRILYEVDVFVSIPKMKQHYSAGVTHCIKNLVGIVPLHYYNTSGSSGNRSALHFEGGDVKTHLPRSICDLHKARPIHLGIIDGIKNAEGGEGPWNPTFRTSEYNLLLAGKDPVALDSVASYQMGNDPEPEKLRLPNGQLCDNHLYLARQKGMGTNILNEIELVGDGAGEIGTSVQEYPWENMSNKIQLFQNYPNPFHASTTIGYYLPKPGNVILKVFNTSGQEIETLVNGYIPAGEHQVHWTIKNLPRGIYYCRLQTGENSETIKLVFYE